MPWIVRSLASNALHVADRGDTQSCTEKRFRVQLHRRQPVCEQDAPWHGGVVPATHLRWAREPRLAGPTPQVPLLRWPKGDSPSRAVCPLSQHPAALASAPGLRLRQCRGAQPPSAAGRAGGAGMRSAGALSPRSAMPSMCAAEPGPGARSHAAMGVCGPGLPPPPPPRRGAAGLRGPVRSAR